VLERWFNSSADAPEQAAFRDYISLVAEWRRLPFLDPGLPTEVRPHDREGEKAKWIYFALIGRIDELAMGYVWRAVGEGAYYTRGRA